MPVLKSPTIRALLVSLGLLAVAALPALLLLPDTSRADTPRVEDAAKPLPPLDAAGQERVALAHKLFEIDGTRAGIDQAIDQLMPMFDMLLEAQDGTKEMSAEDRAKLSSFVREAFAGIFPTFLDKFARHFADAYSEQELQALIAFYESPVGQKSVTSRLMSDQMFDKEMEAMAEQSVYKAFAKFLEWKSQKAA